MRRVIYHLPEITVAVGNTKRGIYCLPEYASKIDKIRKIDDQDTENNSKSSDLTNLIDLTGGTATTPLRKIGHGVAEPEIVATEGVVNGFAISATPEDRKPPETGPLTARVTLRIVRSPAASPQHARRCAQCHGEPDGLELLHMVSGEPRGSTVNARDFSGRQSAIRRRQREHPRRRHERLCRGGF